MERSCAAANVNSCEHAHLSFPLRGACHSSTRSVVVVCSHVPLCLTADLAVLAGQCTFNSSVWTCLASADVTHCKGMNLVIDLMTDLPSAYSAEPFMAAG